MPNDIKKEVRKVFKFLQAKMQGFDKYGNNGFVVLSGKKYYVGRMSYDEWFLEPYKRGRTELDEFDKNTLWEKIDTLEILQLFADNNLLEVRAK